MIYYQNIHDNEMNNKYFIFPNEIFNIEIALKLSVLPPLLEIVEKHICVKNMFYVLLTDAYYSKHK